MHELSIVQNIVETADAIVKERDLKNVKFIVLSIGENTGIMPRYVNMYYKEVCEGTSIEGSEIRIEEIPTECFCKDCGEVFYPMRKNHHASNHYHCPKCHSDDLEILRGNELTIKEIGFE